MVMRDNKQTNDTNKYDLLERKARREMGDIDVYEEMKTYCQGCSETRKSNQTEQLITFSRKPLLRQRQ
jgi:hypothetical protein